MLRVETLDAKRFAENYLRTGTGISDSSDIFVWVCVDGPTDIGGIDHLEGDASVAVFLSKIEALFEAARWCIRYLNDLLRPSRLIAPDPDDDFLRDVGDNITGVRESFQILRRQKEKFSRNNSALAAI